jgi:hypothetical protein
MAANGQTSDVIDILSRDYHPKKLISLALQKAPLTAYFPKSENGQGEIAIMRFHAWNAGGSGATVPQAIATEINDGYKKATFDWRLHYTSYSLGNPAIKRSQGSEQLVDVLQMGMKTTMARHGLNIETFMFGDGNGRLGQRASISGNVITLTGANEAWNFQPGMEIIADDTIDGSSPRVGSTTVSTVNKSGNKITVANAAAITAFADADYLFLKTQVAATAPGLASIIPAVAPTPGDNFGGLDRSIAPDELAGWRYSGSSGSKITETAVSALSWGTNFGGKQDTIVMSTGRLNTLILEQQDKVVFGEMKDEEFKVSRRTVVIQGPDGLVHCLGSPKCPDAFGWALERDSWDLNSVGEPLISNALRTGKVIDDPNDDNVRLRWRSQYALRCSLPGHNGCITW